MDETAEQRRAAGINALRKIGVIVAAEQQADADKAKFVRWFMHYGWMLLTCLVLALAYIFGLV